MYVSRACLLSIATRLIHPRAAGDDTASSTLLRAAFHFLSQFMPPQPVMVAREANDFLSSSALLLRAALSIVLNSRVQQTEPHLEW